MRLIYKITLLFVLISSIVFFIGAMFSYNAMTREINKEEQWFLEERLQSVVSYLERREPTQKIQREKMVITPLDSLLPETKPIFTDTLVTHITLQRIEPHIKLDVIRQVKGRAYKIMLFDLIIEQDDIEDAVRESMIKTYLLLLLVSVILSFVASYLVFKPFQSTLNIIRTFSIKDKSETQLPSSSTKEFRKLNRFINEMMHKAKKDYWALKEFSENASHEIQTPIAIAQAKLELLMEDTQLKETQIELITSTQSALTRISKLSKSLSLLTKIENKEFSDFQEVDLSQLINVLLQDMNELMLLKSIKLQADITPDVKVMGNQLMMEVLFTNLLNNSIKHNYSGGEIVVVLTFNEATIRNTGNPLSVEPMSLFERFKKGTDNPQSSGLGLSIVKLISIEHGFDVKYTVNGKHHELKVSWVDII